MSARRLVEGDRARWRRALIVTLVWIAVACGVLLAIYILLPFDKPHGVGGAVRVVVAALLFSGLTAWQVWRIGRANFPMLRAAEGLTVIITLFLLGFAGTYLTMAHASRSAFSETLNHVRALYFTITVFATVGFGDITPTTDTTRIVVSLQMLSGIFLVGVVVRLIVGAARLRRSQQHPDLPTTS